MTNYFRRRYRVSAQQVIDATCAVLGVDEAELSGHRRHPDIIMARAVSEFFLRYWCHFSYPEIGKTFGKKWSSALTRAKWFAPLVKANDPATIALLEQVVDAIDANAKPPKLIQPAYEPRKYRSFAELQAAMAAACGGTTTNAQEGAS